MRSLDISIKLAPILTAERWGDPKWMRPDRTLYWFGALEFLPPRTEVPLVVDHQVARRVATIRHVFVMDWADGSWYMATGTVDDPPAWLSRDTRCSFGRWTVHESETNCCTRVVKAYVREVSVLRPAHEPREPLARVMSLNRSAPPAAPSSPAARPDRRTAGETVLPAGTLIRRVGIGQVLGVR